VSISSTLKLLQTVPKAQEETADLTVFMAHLGSALVNAAHKMWMKLTIGVRKNYHNKKEKGTFPRNLFYAS